MPELCRSYNLTSGDPLILVRLKKENPIRIEGYSMKKSKNNYRSVGKIWGIFETKKA